VGGGESEHVRKFVVPLEGKSTGVLSLVKRTQHPFRVNCRMEGNQKRRGRTRKTPVGVKDGGMKEEVPIY